MRDSEEGEGDEWHQEQVDQTKGHMSATSHLHHLYACGNRTLRTNVSPVPSIKR